MPDVSISYKNESIATMSASGSKTLQTSGKYCEADIVVSYTKPSPVLQSKSATPTETAQTISPDSGYEGLSSVSVGAISSTYVGSGVTTQSSRTIHPSTSEQTIASATYLTGTQTISAVTLANLIAANIKNGITVKVGDFSDDDSIARVTGTYVAPETEYSLSSTTWYLDSNNNLVMS